MACSAVPERTRPAQACTLIQARLVLCGHQGAGRQSADRAQQRRPRSSRQALADPAGPDSEDLPDMLRHLLALPLTHDLDLSVEVTGTPFALSAPVRRSLQRAASECLVEAARHARARRAVIRLRYGPGVIVLSVADDGHRKAEAFRKIIQDGMADAGGGPGFGLADFACLAEETGGTVRVGPSDLGGIAIEVLVPVPGGTDE